jgi:hypothetical protein
MLNWTMLVKAVRRRDIAAVQRDQYLQIEMHNALKMHMLALVCKQQGSKFVLIVSSKILTVQHKHLHVGDSSCQADCICIFDYYIFAGWV